VTCPHCDSPLAVTDTAGNPWYCCGSTKTFRSMSCLDREPLATKLRAATERIKLLEAVVNDPHALWANWLRGSVALPVGIGDVRQYHNRIKRLEEDLMNTKNKHAALVADVALYEDRGERIKRLEEALRRIANTDYRGNRSTESQIAFEALKEVKP
jgi:hypothetical protein